MAEHKSDTVQVCVNGEMLAEFIVDKLAVQVTRHEVLIRGECRDTYADKVLFNADSLESLGYGVDGSGIPPVKRSWLQRLLAAAGLGQP